MSTDAMLRIILTSEDTVCTFCNSFGKSTDIAMATLLGDIAKASKARQGHLKARLA